MRVWASLSLLHGHAPTPTDTIKDFGKFLSCSCTYCAVLCMYMFTHYTYVYVHVYAFNTVLGRPNQNNQLVVLALTSIFSSHPELSLQGTLHPLYPFQMDLFPIQSGWITYTGRQILSCVGCQPNWQSGLVRTCRMSWDFLTKLIRGQSLAVVGPLQS